MQKSELTPLTFFKCLSEDTRLRCLLLICEMEVLCVCELMAALNESQPKISRHLAQLRQCNLLHDERRGKWVYYRLSPNLPAWASTILSVTLQNHHAFLDDNRKRLATMQNRPDTSPRFC